MKNQVSIKIFKTVLTYFLLLTVNNGFGQSTIPFIEDFGTGKATNTMPNQAITNFTPLNTTVCPIVEGPQDGYYSILANDKSEYEGQACPQQNSLYLDGMDTEFMDHTIGDDRGRFLLVNGKEDLIIYKKNIKGFIIGEEYHLSVWIANTYNPLVDCGVENPMNISLEIMDEMTVMSIIHSSTFVGINSKGIAMPAPDSNALWQNIDLYFIASKTTHDIVLRDNGSSGCGNDYAIDDISLSFYSNSDCKINSVVSKIKTPDKLSCNTPSVILDGSDSEGDNALEYLWSTSNGLIESGSDSAIAVVSKPGDYVLKVTDVEQGCSASTMVYVLSEISVPTVDVVQDEVLSCHMPSVGLMATDVPNYSYLWSTTNGKIISGGDSFYAMVSKEGTYNLNVMDKISGCSRVIPVVVENTCDLGVSHFDFNSDFKVYPNPVKGTLNIESTAGIVIQAIEVSNLSGQLVSNSTDVSTLATGMYALKVITNKGVTTTKFIKE